MSACATPTPVTSIWEDEGGGASFVLGYRLADNAAAAPSSFSVSDWLDIHGLDAPEVCRVLATGIRPLPRIEADRSADKGAGHDAAPAPAPDLETPEAALRRWVLPALELGLADREGKVARALAGLRVDILAPDTDTPAHIVDTGRGLPLAMSLRWGGGAADLLCLAHEAGHALQIVLSDHVFMPPVAREACAFLAELCVIAYAQRQAPALGSRLLDVWEAESATYLGSDLAALREALEDTGRGYRYRFNYPVARLSALHLFERADQAQISALFASGGAGMDHLPLASMGAGHASLANPLPPFPFPDLERPAVAAYQMLGAMILLEMEYGEEGRAEWPIGESYEEWLSSMQGHAAFLALGDARRPFGYVTWEPDPRAPTGRTLRRVTAPFGHQAGLLDALERHFAAPGTADTPSSCHLASDRSSGISVDLYAGLGYTVELLAQSEYHRRFGLGDYLHVEILPALRQRQARFYLTPEGVPTALVTWAWLSDTVEREVHATGRALLPEEWRCGDRLFCNDWITPYGNIREVVHDMTYDVFPNEFATSLRRNLDGTVRRINRWTGVNLRKADQRAIAREFRPRLCAGLENG